MTEPDAQAGGSQHLLDNTGIHAALDRLAEQIAKRFGEADDLCLIGVRRRGDVLAGRLRDRLQILLSADIPTGSLDITLYRDDFDSMSRDPIISESDIPFQLDGRTVILVDDVIFTGRTVRAALDEILDLGRPDRVALAVLIDRGGRELPIAADLIGRHDRDRRRGRSARTPQRDRWQRCGDPAPRGRLKSMSAPSGSLRIDVDPSRIEANLRAFARIGYSRDGGMNRLAFSRNDLRARQYLLHLLQTLGASARIDGFGNVFGRVEGSEPESAAAVGRLAPGRCPGGWTFRWLGRGRRRTRSPFGTARAGITPRHPIELVSFACEESSRFGRGTLGSGIVAGAFDPDEVLSLTDAHGTRLERVLERAGLDPNELAEARRASGDFLAYLEMHIEQGRVLEEVGKVVGVVEGIAAPTRFRVHVQGQADHSGATPMTLRRDALTGAAEIILAVERHARAAGNVVGTVGVATVEPGAMNVVPGRVTLAVDIRSIDASAKAAVVRQIRDDIEATARARNLKTRWSY